MDFTFTPEQEELRTTVRDFLRHRSSPADVLRLIDQEDYDRETWQLMAGQLGLHGLAVPEEYGGAGCGPIELGVVLEEMGRAVMCAPFFATVALASTVLLASDDRAVCKDLLPGIVAGETIATLALVEQPGRWDEDGITMTAEREAGGWRLTGRKDFVLDGHLADVIVVAARTASGLGLFVVDGSAPGLMREQLPAFDQTRRQAALDFDRVPARPVGEPGEAGPALRRTLDLAAVALAAEQLGGAAATLDMAVEYAKIRTQFGRPIGSFQATKHRCADMAMAVEMARGTAYYALWAASTGAEDLPIAASMAKAFCSDAFTLCAETNVQIHGGIAFTWEHPAHLYLKRAKSSGALLGSPRYHRELLAQRAGF